jgi:hypothetical protein
MKPDGNGGFKVAGAALPEYVLAMDNGGTFIYAVCNPIPSFIILKLDLYLLTPSKGYRSHVRVQRIHLHHRRRNRSHGNPRGCEER